jgi:hypothetical protein
MALVDQVRPISCRVCHFCSAFRHFTNKWCVIFLHLLLLLPLPSFYEQIVCHFSCIFCFYSRTCSRFRHFTNKWCFIFLHLLPLPSFYEQMVCLFPAFVALVAASVIVRTNHVSFSCFCCRFRHFTNKWCVTFLPLWPLPSYHEQIVYHFPAFVAASVILRTNDVSFSRFFDACLTFASEHVSLYASHDSIF